MVADGQAQDFGGVSRAESESMIGTLAGWHDDRWIKVWGSEESVVNVVRRQV